ncbi:transmembrane protein, putative (macronuclear) [Tetrahymena thermophila SB210]|uniref:Transmembrane protein, putative n=1 Tax=Tetrahymena thermophila (strain SB210) TaxID=312017 RepID=W7X4T9_TETTS|nr:transmembrane protein, putative [Tetrahymena thermophila SB210]EWS74340.1 transmembrane protein, putative [Tetrahymena thermophila SB210]|eukprot:XP_012653161.1 transmembrane protein, putative [Tetrahymena thermophila SB210]
MYNNSIAQQDQHSVQVPLLNQEYQVQNQQNNYLSYNQLQVQNDQQNQNNRQNQIINFSNGQEMIDPDFLYCKQSMINKSCNDKRRQVEKLSTLLSQVLSQLPLSFTSIQLIGKANIYSGLYCEEKIIKPLIAENTHVNEFLIRNGYVVNCCNILCSTIKSQSFIAVAILLSTLLYQSLLDFIYFNNTYSHINSIDSLRVLHFEYNQLIISLG